MNQLKRFYDIIEELANEEIFIGKSESDLDRETKVNMWWISISSEEQKHLTEEILCESFERIIEKRRQQIIFSGNGREMLFYLWYDEQARQLRFNLISGCHKQLPFGGKHKIISSLMPILKSFLYEPYIEGIPFNPNVIDEFNPEDKAEEDLNRYEFNVYLKRLP